MWLAGQRIVAIVGSFEDQAELVPWAQAQVVRGDPKSSNDLTDVTV
jgi:hypothetical protein